MNSLRLTAQVSKSTEPMEQRAINWLIDQGFENVQVAIQGENLMLSWENRVYRYETLAIATILEKCPLSDISEKGNLILIPKYQNIAMVQVTIPMEALRKFRNRNSKEMDKGFDYVELDKEVLIEFASNNSMIEHPPLFNSTRYKVDLSVEPQLRYLLGNFNNPVKTQVILAPTARVQLYKGLELTGQTLFSIQNDFNNDKRVTAGLITLTKNMKFGKSTFMALSAGYFTSRRLGMLGQLQKYYLNGKLRIDGQMGYTTYSTISGELTKSHIEERQYTMARIGAQYLIESYDLFVKASYGTYLFQDKGLRLEIFRQFGEIRIGLQDRKSVV